MAAHFFAFCFALRLMYLEDGAAPPGAAAAAAGAAGSPPSAGASPSKLVLPGGLNGLVCPATAWNSSPSPPAGALCSRFPLVRALGEGPWLLPPSVDLHVALNLLRYFFATFPIQPTCS